MDILMYAITLFYRQLPNEMWSVTISDVKFHEIFCLEIFHEIFHSFMYTAAVLF